MLKLKLIGILASIFLNVIIFLRTSTENAGLASFTLNSNLLGSPNSAQRFLNILTGIGILVYLSIAFQLNILNT
jgi:preprotein translocase subunit SecG